MEHQVFAPLFSGVEPDRNPVAAHQISLVAVLGICVSQRLERGVRNHPEPCRIRISNYFCVGTYKVANLPIAFSRSIPRAKLRPRYGDGWRGAPLENRGLA